MIVYHGSNSNFKKLRIAKELVKHESSQLNEGLGIYFSTNKKVAESYGKYLYTLEINNKYFVDFRNKSKCQAYIRGIVLEIQQKTDIDILRYINLDTLLYYIHSGNVAISGTCREIYLILDSDEYFYSLPKIKIDRVFQILRTYDSKHLYAYMFNYHIKDIGVIKKVTDDIVKIVNKEIVG